jgi:MSHA biogenesis protein MshO
MRNPATSAAIDIAPRAGRAAGFTLVELVVVIVITSIIVGILAVLIAAPMQAYFAQTRRATLVDSANTARRLIASDVRSALPNSARIWSNGNIRMLELLATTSNATYYFEPGPPAPRPLLDLSAGAPDADFSTLGLFANPVPPNTGYVVINNLGTPGADAYSLSNVIAPVNTITASTAPPPPLPPPPLPPIDSVHLNPAFTFVADSPAHRVFLLSSPLPSVAYLCDQAAQTLTRYWGYGITATPGAHDSAAKMLAAGAQSALVARNITSCTFGTTPGTANYGQLVMLQLLLSTGGENLPVMVEVSEDNPS